MKLKKMKGVVALSIYGLITGISNLHEYIFKIIRFYKGTYHIADNATYEVYLEWVLGVLFGISIIISAIYILKRKRWARLLFIYNIGACVISMFYQASVVTLTCFGYPLLFRLSGYISRILFAFTPFVPDMQNSNTPWVVSLLLSWAVTLLLMGSIFYLNNPKIKQQFARSSRR